jgi:hypothetical protein
MSSLEKISLISNRKVHHNFMYPDQSLTGKYLVISLTQEHLDNLKLNFSRMMFGIQIINLNFTLILEI